MKRILVIKTIITDFSSDITKNFIKYINKIKANDTEIKVVSLEKGPTSVGSLYDKTFSSAGVLRIVDKYKSDYDAVVLSCFSDPALHEAREISNIPIIGPGEASMTATLMLGHKFGVVQTSRDYEPWIELQARNIGIEKRFVGIAGIDIPFVELERDPAKTARYFLKASKELIDQKNAEVILMGCTGMAPIAELVRKELPVPIIEPMSMAVKTAELMADLKLSHSKIGLYMNRENTANICSK